MSPGRCIRISAWFLGYLDIELQGRSLVQFTSPRPRWIWARRVPYIEWPTVIVVAKKGYDLVGWREHVPQGLFIGITTTLSASE